MSTLTQLLADGPVLYPTTFVDTTGRPAGILKPDGTILHKSPSTVNSTITLDNGTLGTVVWNGETNLLGNGRYVDSTHVVARLCQTSDTEPSGELGETEDPINEP